MITLKDFLVEAQFSEDDFSRVISSLQRRLPRLIGAKLYRKGGADGVEKLPNAEAILYFFDDRAFQIRYKAGKLLGIDVWKKYTIDGGPAYSIDLSDLNAPTLLGSISKLAALIKKPEEGKIPVEQLTESVQLDEMASRVGPADFYTMSVKALGPDGAKNMTWDEIKKVASDNDVLVPAYIRDQKVSRGRWTAEVTGDTEAREAGKKEEAKAQPTLYIKVTAQDPTTKKFLSTADSKPAQALYAQIQQSLEKPSETEIKDPETLFGHLHELTQMACNGTLRSLLVYGGPGLGKTHTIMKTIQEEGLSKGKDYVKLSGKATPIEIYKTLFMFRDKGLVVFDDLDSMWGDKDAENVLKAALDTSKVREISWASSNTINVSKMSDAERQELFNTIDDAIDRDPAKVKYPSTFDFKGNVIFISNLKKEDFDPAIMSRSAKIDMTLSPAQVLERMKKLLPTLGDMSVSIEKKEALLDHLQLMHKNREITQLTMREFVKGCDIVKSGSPNWKSLMSYM